MLDREFEKELDKLDLATPTGRDDYKFISLRVSPQTAKILEEFTDRERFTERIIRRHFLNNFNIIENEVNELETVTVRYQGHQLRLVDALQKIDEKYVDAIDNLCETLGSRKQTIAELVSDPLKKEFKEISDAADGVIAKIDTIGKKVESVNEALRNIPSSYSFKDILEVLERWEKLSPESQEIFAPLLRQK